jgi:hypothetical protein
MSACRVPCPTCPWRREQHADEIPNFSIELAENLIHTTRTDHLGTIFACHQSKDGQEVVCVGWLWRYGWDSIAIRLRLLRQMMSPEELDTPEDFDDILHRNFDEVITKLRADVEQDPITS